MAIESAAEFHDFQAEYEGSIPFTRSNVFKGLTHAPKFILTNPNFHSDKCSLFGRLLRQFGATFDALHLRVLLGFVIVVQIVRHRCRRPPLTLLHQLRFGQSGGARFRCAAMAAKRCEGQFRTKTRRDDDLFRNALDWVSISPLPNHGWLLPSRRSMRPPVGRSSLMRRVRPSTPDRAACFWH
jgi:hypothetical protein